MTSNHGRKLGELDAQLGRQLAGRRVNHLFVLQALVHGQAVSNDRGTILFLFFLLIMLHNNSWNHALHLRVPAQLDKVPHPDSSYSFL